MERVRKIRMPRVTMIAVALEDTSHEHLENEKQAMPSGLGFFA